MSDEIALVRDGLDALAARIVHEHQQGQEAATRAVLHAMAAGDLLIEAKARCGHGAWGAWLANRCALSERTAQVYMRLARNRPAVEAKAQHAADLSIRQAVGLLTEARPLPEAAVLTDAERRHLAALETRIERGLAELEPLYGSREAVLAALAPMIFPAA